MSDPQSRTPEDVLWVALRSLATDRTAAQAGYGRQADTIIQALAQAGFAIVPVLSSPGARELKLHAIMTNRPDEHRRLTAAIDEAHDHGTVTWVTTSRGKHVAAIVPGQGHQLYTREQVSGALNDAANTLSEHDYESSETIAADDAVNLLVNTAMYLLDHPDGSLDDAIAAQYADSFDIRDLEDLLDEGEAIPEPGTEQWNQLVVAKVKGWVS